MKETTTRFTLTVLGLAASIMWSGSLLAQSAPRIEWQRCYGGKGLDRTGINAGKSIVNAGDGGYVFLAQSDSLGGDVVGIHKPGPFGRTMNDIWAVKISSLGAIEWQVCLGGTNEDEPGAIVHTADNGFVITGHVQSNDGDVSGNLYGNNAWLAKLDSSGAVRWKRNFGGGSAAWQEAQAYSVIETHDGSIVVAGHEQTVGEGFNNHGGTDGYVVKFASDGTLKWQQCFGGSDEEFIFGGIRETTDGGFVFAGETNTLDDGEVTGHHTNDSAYSIGNRDIWLVRLDSNGNLLWQKCLGGTRNEHAGGLLVANDGGYLVTGSTDSFDGDVSGFHFGRIGYDYDAWVVKLDSVGSIQWSKCLGGSASEGLGEVIQTKDGGYVICGSTNSTDGDVKGHHAHGISDSLSDAWLVKLDADGSLQWQMCLGGSANEGIQSVQQTSDSEFVLAGITNSNDDDVAGNHGDYDVWVVKLSAPLNSVQGDVQAAAYNAVVFPNPSSANVRIELPEGQRITGLIVYDILGRQVTPAFEISLNFALLDVNALSEGSYFARVSFGTNGTDRIDTAPFVVRR